MSPIRKTETVRCRRRVHERVWTSPVPVIRDGRIQTGAARWALFEFGEADYCYGVGTLTMRVERIDWDRPVPYESDTWLEVSGTVIDREGREGARRTVLVRASLLPQRPPRKRPRLRP